MKRTVHAMLAAAASLENRDIPASSLLTDEAMTSFGLTHNQSCFNAQTVFTSAAFLSWSRYPTVWRPGVNPFTRPDTKAILAENSPGRVKLSIPIFVGQVVGDPCIQEARTDELVRKARQVGNAVTYCKFAKLNRNLDIVSRSENHNAFGRVFPDDWSKEPAEACTGVDGAALPRFANDGTRLANPALVWLDKVLAAR